MSDVSQSDRIWAISDYAEFGDYTVYCASDTLARFKIGTIRRRKNAGQGLFFVTDCGLRPWHLVEIARIMEDVERDLQDMEDNRRTSYLGGANDERRCS